jgi:hypothetical protein
MPKLQATAFKYFYVAKYLAKGKQLDSGYFLGLDLGSRVFGMATAVMPVKDALPVAAKNSRD